MAETAKTTSPTSDELTALCASWQKLLRLQDWDVYLRCVHRGDLDHADVYGKIDWLLHHKVATISLVIDASMAEHDPHYNPERTLVHELLHLFFIVFETESGSQQDTALEQALTTLARAFVTLRGDSERAT